MKGGRGLDSLESAYEKICTCLLCFPPFSTHQEGERGGGHKDRTQLRRCKLLRSCYQGSQGQRVPVFWIDPQVHVFTFLYAV